MKRWLRRIAIAAGSLVAVLLVGIGTAVGPVDHTAFDRTAYHRSTLDGLDSAAREHRPVRGTLRAGVGRARLTPTLGAEVDDGRNGRFRSLPLAGFGNRRGAPATGVHDDLWVKATAVEVGGSRMILVSADSLIVPREVCEAAVVELRRLTGLTRDQLHFGASHTHASIGGWGQGIVAEMFAGPFQPEVRIWFSSRLVAAATNALADLRPASFATAAFSAPELIRNRLVGDRGTVDPEFVLLEFRRDDGAKAVLGSFGAHATVLSSKLMEFSAEYPGSWQRRMEETGWAHAQFFAGGVGSHSPNAGAPGFEGTERMGRILAERSAESLKPQPATNRAEFVSLAVPVALPELNPRVSDNLRLRPWLASGLLPVADRTFITGFRIGGLVWLTTPCDFSGEMSLPHKAALAARGFRANISSFNGDYIGYVVPAKYYHLDTYETRTMSFFGPAVPDLFDSVLRELSARLTADPG
jgi:neutral ceramidase